jgi:DNA polymerase I-like protein with 3'-5' exonuclease and polymerase domains
MPVEEIDDELLAALNESQASTPQPSASPALSVEDEGIDEVSPPVAARAVSAPATSLEEEGIDEVPPPAVALAPPPQARPADDDDFGDTLETFVQTSGLQQEREVPDIQKPWMKFHKFIRCQTVAEVEEIVDAALAHGRCALDLETQGLDNRIVWDEHGNPSTVHQIVGFCISVDGVTGYYIPIRHKNFDGPDLNVPVAGVEAAIKRLCLAAQPQGTAESIAKDPLSFPQFTIPPQVVIYFWNGQFDQEFLFPITGIDWWHPDSWEDGMLANFTRYAADKALGLKYKAPEVLRDPEGNVYEMTELKDLFIRGMDIAFGNLAPDEPGVIKYGASDAICTYLLCDDPRPHEKKRENLIKLVKTKHAFTYRLEKQVAQAVRGMERHRVKVHRGRIKELYDEHVLERDSILQRIQEFGATKGWHGLDPNSSKQLSDFLFTDGPNCCNITITATKDYPGGKPPKNEKSGQYKTDADTLEGMVAENAHAPPVLKWVVEFRGVEKIIGTYLTHLLNNPDKNDELRFSFKQTGAGTGRFSAPANADKLDHGFGGIPIHGIPGESSLRKTFIARPGYTIAKCDYAGQELRIAANVSGEPVWLREFLEGDGDLHSITARAFYGTQDITKDQRKAGKIANFALIYGGGPQAIMRATGCDKVEGSRRKQAFDKSVPTFAGWIKKQHAAVKRDEGVTTAFGRWLAVPDANINTGVPEHDRMVQAACERYSTNYPIQGAGADIMKISMVLLHKEFFKRGWLRTGGDDSVRMLMTVHDEIVFEIKHDRVAEAIPLIVKVMESPTKLAKPSWRVPLIVEPLIGPNWGSGYKCEHAKPGHGPKPNEILVQGFIYGRIRVVDLGKDKPEESDGEVEDFRDEKGKKIGIRIVDPPWLRNVTPDDPNAPPGEAPPEGGSEGEPPKSPSATPGPTDADSPVDLAAEGIPTEVAPPVTAPPPAPKHASPPAAAKKNGKSRVVTMKIWRLNGLTVKQVRMACFMALEPNGKLLQLTDSNGTVIVDPALGVRINPEHLVQSLFHLNLGDGGFVEEP